MASKLQFPDIGDVRRMYDEGRCVREIAEHFGFNFHTFFNWAKRSGLQTRSQPEANRIALAGNHAEIAKESISLYRSGMSEQAIAARFGVDRNVVRRILLRAGITPRNRSASMYLRMSQTSADERKRLTSAAHNAVRGMVRTEAELAIRAATRERTQSKVGNGERLFAKWLAARGIDSSPQKAVGRYNLDLAIPPIAVEIHITPDHPLNHPRSRKRIKYLTDRGWHVLYVWISHRYVLAEAAADDAIAFLQLAKRDKSPVGKYRVIRGSGEFVAEGRGDLD